MQTPEMTNLKIIFGYIPGVDIDLLVLRYAYSHSKIMAIDEGESKF